MDQKQLMRPRHEAGCYRSDQGRRRGREGRGGEAVLQRRQAGAGTGAGDPQGQGPPI